MISREKIRSVLSGYDKSKIVISTICSHSALQIFAGAREEGFSTIGICTADRVDTYKAFPHACPDEFIVVGKYSDVLSKKFQDLLLERNAVMVPHGSFVEYLGPQNIMDKLYVPVLGNREVLVWEGDRALQKRWLADEAKVSMPEVFSSAKDIDRLCIVKFHGAKGGSGYFLVGSYDEFRAEAKRRGITEKDVMIQEYISGVRYYLHFFYSPVSKVGYPCGDGRLELTGVDRRDESNIDELHRAGIPRSELASAGVDVSFTVTGNTPCVLRESLLPAVFDIGNRVVLASQRLFSPGISGPFCLECVVLPDLSIRVFEISARIVAGTNIYTHESPYSHLTWGEPMSCGRRIGREVKIAFDSGALDMLFF